MMPATQAISDPHAATQPTALPATSSTHPYFNALFLPPLISAVFLASLSIYTLYRAVWPSKHPGTDQSDSCSQAPHSQSGRGHNRGSTSHEGETTSKKRLPSRLSWSEWSQFIHTPDDLKLLEAIPENQPLSSRSSRLDAELDKYFPRSEIIDELHEVQQRNPTRRKAPSAKDVPEQDSSVLGIESSTDSKVAYEGSCGHRSKRKAEWDGSSTTLNNPFLAEEDITDAIELGTMGRARPEACSGRMGREPGGRGEPELVRDRRRLGTATRGLLGAEDDFTLAPSPRAKPQGASGHSGGSRDEPRGWFDWFDRGLDLAVEWMVSKTVSD